MSFEVRVDGATLLSADVIPDHINAPTVLAPITIAQEIGERPTASLNAWWPSAAGLSELVLGLGGDDVLGLGGDDVLGIGRAGIPEDYSEVTIDSPELYYRAAALELSPIAYWPLDESPSVQARDVSGNGRHLDYDDADPQTVDWRETSGEAAAIPHGGSPLFVGDTDPGLSGLTLPDIGTTFALVGFVGIPGGSTGSRSVWYAGGSGRSMSITVLAGVATLSMFLDGQSIDHTGLSFDDWHHVGVKRTPAAVELWVDGVLSGSASHNNASATPLDGRAMTFAKPISGAETNIRLDEWGIWASDVDVADLEARRRHRRLFGGYAFGVKTSLHQGGLGDRQVKIPCTGYGIVLDRTSEIIRRRDNAAPEMPAPQAIDHHAACQRMVGIRQPLGQLQAAALRIRDRGTFAAG